MIGRAGFERREFFNPIFEFCDLILQLLNILIGNITSCKTVFQPLESGFLGCLVIRSRLRLS